MKFHCPHCSQKIDAPEEYAGHNINCPSCQKPITVPVPAPAPVAPKLTAARPPTTPAAPSVPPLMPAANVNDDATIAPLLPRIMAKVLDFVITGAVMTSLALTSHYLVRILNQNGTGIETQHVIGTCFLFVAGIFPFLYNYLPLAGGGATLGKKIFGLKVTRQNGRPLGYDFALWRCLAEYVCVAAGFGVAMMIFIGATRSQMHAPLPHRHGPILMLFTLPVFALGFAAYVPAFFTKGRRAAHDLIAQTKVIK